MVPAATIVLWLLGGVLAVVTALSAWRTDEWWVRVWDFPRVQIALLLAAVIIAGLVLLDLSAPGNVALLLALALALGYQVYRFYRYLPLAPRQVVRVHPQGRGGSIRLLTANVLMKNQGTDQFLGIVRAADPDIVLAMETDGRWDRALQALDAGYPFSVKHPLDNTYGMHLFSRLELRRARVHHLVEDHVPSIHAEVRLPSGSWVQLYCVHPPPPRPAQDTEERDAELVIVGRLAKRAALPAIVVGDMNDVAWSHTTRLFQRVSGLLDPRIGRGPYSTFPAKYPGIRWAVDHVFHDRSFGLVELKRCRAFGSDHLPILVELCHDAAACENGKPAEADADDHREAKRIVERAET